MKTKTFDCVQMKREGALRIYERLKGMTVEEQVAYWRERNAAFLEEHDRLAEKAEKHPSDS